MYLESKEESNGPQSTSNIKYDGPAESSENSTNGACDK